MTLPILPVLAKTLAARPRGDLAFIANASGQPFTKESFGNAFADACRAAGITKSAHGIRKLAATRAANSGATEAQLKAIFGWTNSKMPTLYTKSANNRRLAKQAMHLLDHQNEDRTSMPSPMGEVWARKIKRKRNQSLSFTMVGGDGLEPPTFCV